jgi:hypothetical protein
MSEETKTEVVEEENPSTAEKETIALKKIGADVGVESITKVDLRETPTEETTEEPVEEAPQEEKKEESQTETQESEESNQLTLEEIIEDEESDEVKEEEKPIEEETTKEEVVEEPVETTPEIELPENIQKVIDFMNETGGTLEDYVKINQDYSNIEDSSLLYEYYTQTKSHLSKDEIDFLIEDNFSFDDEVDDPKDIKRKKLAYKEEIAKAKSHLEGLKGKYYEEVKLGSKLSPDQQEAIQFYNTYNTEQSEVQKTQEKQTAHFNNETNKVFSEDFKGFEFKVGENKKYRFNIKDKQSVQDKQANILNVFDKYINDNNMLQDANGYHKALFVADNADEVANHFYEQGRADAIKQLNAESKNINMDPRKTGIVEAGGVKVRAISGDDSSKLRVKIKK